MIKSPGARRELVRRRLSRDRAGQAPRLHLHLGDEGPSGGIETLVTITFAKRDGKTVQTFHQDAFRNVERRDSHVGGWSSAFDKHAAYAEKLAKEHAHDHDLRLPLGAAVSRRARCAICACAGRSRRPASPTRRACSSKATGQARLSRAAAVRPGADLRGRTASSCSRPAPSCSTSASAAKRCCRRIRRRAPARRSG